MSNINFSYNSFSRFLDYKVFENESIFDSSGVGWVIFMGHFGLLGGHKTGLERNFRLSGGVHQTINTNFLI